MKHIRAITANKPAAADAQLNIFLQIVSAISAVIGVVSQIDTLFGLNLSKDDAAA
jgi:hypothetical protein